MKGICAVLALTLAAACQQEQRMPAAHGAKPSTRVTNPFLVVPPNELRATLEGTYLLTPDRRFLLAIPEIDRILTGRAKEVPAVALAGGVWHVRYAGQDLGTLPEFPSYNDAIALLTAFARGRRTAPGTADAQDASEQIERFEAADVMAALRRIDDLWPKTHGRELLEPAARGLTYLVEQQFDLFAVGDLLPAKALAAVAVAKAFDAGDLRRTEALLSNATGYVNDSSAIARQLPESDPARLYVLGDDRGLERAANDVNATILTRYLNVMRAAKSHDDRNWLTALTLYGDERRLSLAIIKSGMFLGRFDANADLSRAAAGVAFHETEGTSTENVTLSSIIASANPVAVIKGLADAYSKSRATFADRFESELARTGGGLSGPFLDAATRAAYLRSGFYSGVFRYGQHQLDGLSSVDAAEMLDNLLGHPRDARASQYSKWFHDLVVWKATQRHLGTFIDDLGQLDLVGEPALARTFEEIRRAGAYSDPRTIEAARLLFRRADSRISQRVDVADAASRVLLDLPLSEKLYGLEAAATPGDPLMRESMAWFNRDVVALRQLAADRDFDGEARAKALENLEEAGALDENGYRARMRDLLRQEPFKFPIVWAYVQHLAQHNGTHEIESVVPAWLHDNPQLDDPFLLWDLQTRLAQAWLADGRPNEAWNAVAPYLSSWKGGVLIQGALALNAMGRRDEARKLAQQTVDRYPDASGPRLTLVEILWRQHDYPAAASALVEPPIAMSAWDWRAAGTSFVKVFGGAPVDLGATAFAELVHRKLSVWDLQQFIDSIDAEGKHELAFRAASQLKSDGIANLDLLLDDYAYLKAWKGEPDALSWLRAQAPSGRNPASMFIFPHRDLALLWTFVDEPASGDEQDFVWLMRAGATLISPAERAAHLPEVVSYFSKPDRRGEYFTIGRYLLGLADETAVLQLATNPKQRCEVAYYIGLKAMSENHLTDASDWFRIACETEQSHTEEYRWAKDTLLEWIDRDQSLRLIAAARQWSSGAH